MRWNDEQQVSEGEEKSQVAGGAGGAALLEDRWVWQRLKLQESYNINNSRQRMNE